MKDSAKKLKDRLTGDDLAQAQQDQLNEYADLGIDRINGYALFERYYNGEFKTNLPKRARDFLEANGLKYGEGYCDKVADARTNRLRVEAFTTDEQGESTPVADYLEEWGEDHGFPELQDVVHDGIEVKGDMFVAIEFDNDLNAPFAYSVDPATCAAHYNKRGDLELVVHVWGTSDVSPTNPNGKKIRRMNLHYEDRVEKWFTTSEGTDSIWAKHVDAGDEDWPIWWTRGGTQDGEPLGVNIKHFRRLPRGNKTYGTSVIKQAVPMQDGFNKKLIDEFYVLDQQAFNQRWAIGVDTTRNLNVNVGTWIKSANKDAKFGQLEATDPKRLTDNMEAALRRFATSTSTPLQEMVVSGTISGESRRQIGTGLVDEVERTKGYLTRPWRQFAEMLLTLEDEWGDEPVGELPRLTVQWKDYEDRTDGEILDTLVTEVRDLGLSRRTALTKRGYDADAELEASAAEKAESAARILDGMDGGNGADDVVDDGENP